MRVVQKITELRQIVREERASGKIIGLVPTMGYLHEGHISLVKRAKADESFVVMSIFVNPLQFGPGEDYGKYPRDFERDSNLAREAGVDVIFCPEVNEMYPEEALTQVEVGGLTAGLCGKSRPGHFRGVATVVSKLFNLVQPDKAYFGLKDYQQYTVIRKMVKDLNFPIEIIGVPIVREEDGLALSSRNVYLSSEERKEALVLFKSLEEAENLILSGKRNVEGIKQVIAEKIIKESSGQIDYVEIVGAEDLSSLEVIDRPVVIALAVRFGRTRLIDNKVVEV